MSLYQDYSYRYLPILLRTITKFTSLIVALVDFRNVFQTSLAVTSALASSLLRLRHGPLFLPCVRLIYITTLYWIDLRLIYLQLSKFCDRFCRSFSIVEAVVQFFLAYKAVLLIRVENCCFNLLLNNCYFAFWGGSCIYL